MTHTVTPFVVPATIKSETAEKSEKSQNKSEKAAKPPNEKLQKITFALVFIGIARECNRVDEGGLLDDRVG